MNIYLTGFMGAGKSAAGKLLAQRLGRDLIDSDRLIEARLGLSVREIFMEHGERAFREWESAIISEISQLQNRVVALGGGAILSERNRSCISTSDVVLYLRASAQSLLDRLDDRFSSRPLLALCEAEMSDRQKIVHIEEILASRARRYELAHLIIDTDRITVDQTAELILEMLNYAQIKG